LALLEILHGATLYIAYTVIFYKDKWVMNTLTTIKLHMRYNFLLIDI